MTIRPVYGRVFRIAIPVAVLLLFLGASLDSANSAAAVTTVTAYKAQTPVTLNGVVEPGEWSDTPQLVEPNSGMTVAFKQNGTGLLFLMQWNESTPYCTDSACFGGIEIGFLNNTAEMGSPSTPTIMVLTSPAFKTNVDEFISTGDQTPASVESDGYSTQSVCGLALVGQEYTAECYRPFTLNNASPYDPFPSLAAGNPIEIAFAVGEFTSPGDHLASDMSTYVLILSNQTYTPTTSSSSTATSTSTTITLSTGPASSSSSTSSMTVTSSVISSSIITSTSPSTASTYAEELLVMTIGFTVLVLVMLARYESS